MKGIILAGGSGTRLFPLTIAVSKQLMPVYDKPMIYYPLSILMLAGIKDILIITTPQDSESFQKLLGDGSQVGCNFQYKVQPSPDGLAQAFVIGEEFIGNDSVALVLGDNIFYGTGISALLESKTKVQGGCVFAYQVSDPERYGVVEFDENFKALSIEEKPELDLLVNTGFYIMEKKVLDYIPEDTFFHVTHLIDALAEAKRPMGVFPISNTAWTDIGQLQEYHDGLDKLGK